jgi:hypothetical protein
LGVKTASSACPLHRAGPALERSGRPAPLLDCHKCVLGCALGVYHPAASGIVIPSVPLTAAHDPLPDLDFYSLALPPILRPPITGLTG